jgi:hypothetical protein
MKVENMEEYRFREERFKRDDPRKLYKTTGLMKMERKKR